MLAAHYYRVAADMGHPPSCVALGDLYREGGIGKAADMSSAFSYYKMAADTGDADGCVALGEMWEKGQGVVLVSMTTGVLQQDPAQAVRLYGAAADLGHAVGQSNLGRMCRSLCLIVVSLCCIFLTRDRYEHGTGVPQDLVKALEYEFFHSSQHRMQCCIR
jgi:TPR repeat protein